MKVKCVFEFPVGTKEQQDYFMFFLQRFVATLHENQTAVVELYAQPLPEPPPVQGANNDTVLPTMP